MLRRMVASSLRYRFIVVAIAVGTMLFGVQELRSAPVDVFPEFAPPRVEIQTAALGLSANEVESFVTVPLEQALAGLPALDILRSNSVAQLSQIELLFKPDADLMHSRQLVQERIESITPTLPTWAAPPFMMPPVSATSRVMKIGMSSKSMSVMDMSLITYWTIRSRLLSVPGVANIPIFARLLRGSMLGVRTSSYIASARVLGLPRRRVLGVHMLPNAVSPLIVAATLALATAIIETAGLGFLGLGNNDPAQPEWGAMLANTTRYLQSAPHLAFFPGIAIVITVLGFNLLGDGLREAIDPRLI